MGGVAGPKLVAAAANAGALAILPIWFGTPATAAEVIDKTSKLTSRPFAVNLRADLKQDDLIAAALDAGADALIAQGMEAGGHVFGTTPLAELIPSVVEAAAGVPVAAAGGIVDGVDVATAFKLGATAAVLGTRLVVTDESDAHPAYIEALLDADDGDTVLSKCFDGFWPNAPHRTLNNSTYRAWSEAGFPSAGQRPGEGDILMRSPVGTDIPRYHAATPTNRMSGDCEAMALYAGKGVGRIKTICSTQSVIDEIVMDAAAWLTKTRGD